MKRREKEKEIGGNEMEKNKDVSISKVLFVD